MSARRDLRAARQENAVLRADLRAERAARADLETRLAIGGEQFTAACDRVLELTTQVCQLETQLAATQQQLDDATGMDSDRIAAGADWGARREDRPNTGTEAA